MFESVNTFASMLPGIHQYSQSGFNVSNQVIFSLMNTILTAHCALLPKIEWPEDFAPEAEKQCGKYFIINLIQFGLITKNILIK